MALNSIVSNALSGLQASQIGLRTASSNVANVNTPGYARTEVQLAARNSAGQGMGVEVTGVRRVADQFLTAASMRAASDAGLGEAVFAVLDRLQAQFGSTDDAGSLFGRLDTAMSSIAAAVVDPAERVARLSAASDLQSFFDEAQRLSTEIRAMRAETDSRIEVGVERVNEILVEIEQLNSEVRGLKANGADVSGAENRQAELMDELSRFMDVRGEVQTDGRLFVRTGDGVSLLDNVRLQLDYTPSGTGAYGADYGPITAVVSSSGATVDMTRHIQSGELKGLMRLRDQDLPELAAQLAEFASGAADALNAAHNDASSYPAPNSLEGRQTGLLGTDLLRGTGEASLAVVDAGGALVRRVDLAFGPGGFTVNGAAGTSIDDLVTELNAAFGGDATASFVDGRLTVSATDPAAGVAALQDPADPSSLGGRGFSQFFGLNDLVDSARPAFFETAIDGASPLGAAPGGTMSFAVKGADGRRIADVAVAIPSAPGSTVNDMLAALNDPASGLGAYGSFTLDGNGRVAFAPNAGYAGAELTLTADDTQRGGTGLGLSQVFGIGDAARLNRAEGFTVAPEIRADSGRFAFAKLDLSATSAPGDLVLAQGDGRGGQALQDAFAARRPFEAAGALSGGTTTVRDYAARLAGEVGARAARAERAQDSALAVKAAADQKRADVEGVNLDEELARMTLFQTSYNASARMLQAAQEMTDTLLNLV